MALAFVRLQKSICVGGSVALWIVLTKPRPRSTLYSRLSAQTISIANVFALQACTMACKHGRYKYFPPFNNRFAHSVAAVRNHLVRRRVADAKTLRAHEKSTSVTKHLNKHALLRNAEKKHCSGVMPVHALL